MCRFNFFYGLYEEYKERIDMVKKVREKLNKLVVILLDIKGLEIRIGNFEDLEVFLEEG